MDAQFFTLASLEWQLLPIVGVVGGIMIVIFIIVGKVVTDMHQTRHHEESRREIAAYVAEGSMTPQDGEALLRAGTPADPKDKA